MCGAQQGSVIGLVLFEGWASSVEEARAQLDRGEVALEPNHHHHGVGPMAGTTSPSLPVWVVENRGFGNRAYCRPPTPPSSSATTRRVHSTRSGTGGTSVRRRCTPPNVTLSPKVLPEYWR